MVTAEESVASALVLKNESHDSPRHASNSDLGENSPAVPKKPSEDGYSWRKYGQKNVRRNEYIRSYYKCSDRNCPVKKQVEHAHDGRITDTTYFGEHKHPKPQNNLPVPIPPVVSVDVQIADKSSSPHALTIEEVESKDTNKLAIVEISPEGRDRALQPPSETKNEGNKNSKLALKRRRKGIDDAEPMADKISNKACHVVETVSVVDVVNDGYRWRKYGQKLVKGNPHPRSYYRCSQPGCPVKKHVERAFRDPKVVVTMYEGEHEHDVPPVRTILPQSNPPSLCKPSAPNGVENSNKPDQSSKERQQGEAACQVVDQSGSSEQTTPDNMEVSSCQESSQKEGQMPDSEPVNC